MINLDKKKEIGLRIRTMRKSRDMTQDDLGKALGQSASSITMYETGRREPDFETLEALADIFNVPLAYLVSDDSSDSSGVSIPQTEEARILAKGIDQLPKEQREQALSVIRAMFVKYADYFEKENDADDT